MDNDEDVGSDDEGAVCREDAVVTSDSVEQSKQEDADERQNEQSFLQLFTLIPSEPVHKQTANIRLY